MNIMQIDGQLKKQQKEFYHYVVEATSLRQLLNHFTVTISKIHYQLLDDDSQVVKITNDNINDFLSLIGLQLEKIITFIYLRGNGNNDSSLDDFLSQNQQNEPPEWMRLFNNNQKKNPGN